jgi:hypothetical protein
LWLLGSSQGIEPGGEGVDLRVQRLKAGGHGDQLLPELGWLLVAAVAAGWLLWLLCEVVH